MQLVQQSPLEISTSGRGTYEITQEINKILHRHDIQTGTVHLFLQHTSASLIISENADPSVRQDLETFMGGLVPDGDPRYIHQDEGPDDMPAHVRSVLTQCSLTLPVTRTRLALGTWQGVYLWEHRTSPHRRRIMLTTSGYQETL